MATMAELFDPEPERWGLRGDPHLWRAFRDHLDDRDIPASPAGVAGLLYDAFMDIVGVDLAGHPESSVYREGFAHGGMSSGMISLDTWRDRLIPLLTERASRYRAESG